MVLRAGVSELHSQCKHRDFQLELYIDAFQGAVLSALLFFVFPLDVVLMRDPYGGSFYKVLNLGWRSEACLNYLGSISARFKRPLLLNTAKLNPKPKSDW